MKINEHKKSYYVLLGVTARASQEEIRAAFRKKAREFHPDVCNRFDAAEMFSLINKAYSTLKDPKKRQEYNETLMADMFQKQVVDPSKEHISHFNFPFRRFFDTKED
ncbi:MAG: DnaJ domain-containing protein [Chromatiaceae bacterium]|nr:DnaJ domain-containing protein [Gammaproteobacteria bacterium]MCP5428151.1 DnaJ domain-containing protein [Chromatiaceae bacterium]MCB1862596.1 DnaJ domain-containing protein [Gammaproteobacteria bacterium]MCB1872664.1 DnaJ domain-containing protein [Gammaproteobacteria bacterium]MCB1880322.1 DnaJ domain-containing protein [Gammaproteobacteria bacterium]